MLLRAKCIVYVSLFLMNSKRLTTVPIKEVSTIKQEIHTCFVSSSSQEPKTITNKLSGKKLNKKKAKPETANNKLKIKKK